MRRHLWKDIIEESGYEGVSIPYMVGKFYQNGLIAKEDLQNANCIKIVLENIRNSDNVNDEAFIIPCDSYTPPVPMIHLLHNQQRTNKDITTIEKHHPNIKNTNGRPTIYLPLFGYNDILTIDDLSQRFWAMYEHQIICHKFSVSSSSEIQEDGTYHIWE